MSLVLGSAGLASKAFLRLACRPRVRRLDVLLDAVFQRPKDTPLITVSNHRSCVDDPLLWGVLPTWLLTDWARMRWTLVAQEICFPNAFLAWFFSRGKGLPVVRGKGLVQSGMEMALAKLNDGGWVHIFPEARVNQTGRMMPLRWGVGELVRQSSVPPLVLPLWHEGMEKVLPEGRPYILRVGKSVDVLVDRKPLRFEDLLSHHRHTGSTPETIRSHITDVIESHLFRLQGELLSSRLGDSESSVVPPSPPESTGSPSPPAASGPSSRILPIT